MDNKDKLIFAVIIIFVGISVFLVATYDYNENQVYSFGDKFTMEVPANTNFISNESNPILNYYTDSKNKIYVGFLDLGMLKSYYNISQDQPLNEEAFNSLISTEYNEISTEELNSKNITFYESKLNESGVGLVSLNDTEIPVDFDAKYAAIYYDDNRLITVESDDLDKLKDLVKTLEIKS
ncbi:MAG: hypothetical protein KO202_04035 [Methanobacteriaceae archaeon]|jgi:hypothetical protein|nr:hypothetical protein [Methanobacteriaceae archaeon]